MKTEIDKKGRRVIVRVKAIDNNVHEHRVITGNTLEEIWLGKDSREAQFEQNGTDSWIVKDVSGTTIGWLQLEPAPVAKNGPRRGMRQS